MEMPGPFLLLLIFTIFYEVSFETGAINAAVEPWPVGKQGEFFIYYIFYLFHTYIHFYARKLFQIIQLLNFSTSVKWKNMRITLER